MFYLLFAVVMLAGLAPLTVTAQPAAPIEQALLDQLADGPANLFVKMSVEADLSAAAGLDWDARGQYVWDAVNQVADATQGPVLDYCAKNGLDCKPMVINNSVFVRSAGLDAAQGLAALPGVAFLRLERVYELDPINGGAGINGFVGEAGASPDALAWGITYTKADQFWTAFGVQGDAIKVANIDTGVQWNHPALDQAFACPGAPSDADCWADPSNICGGSACDNNGHGTHTMGTMVADDDPGLTWQAGMAPNATWIACKGCETNSCSDFALTTCANWILAPGGDPANRPHVVNNSWGGGSGDPWYLSYVQAWVAAGTFPAFSAGNSGSSCGTMGDPGTYQESFASAAHDSGGNIASFSSRGPSPFGHDPYTKPNIASPGVSVCSSVPTNAWSCGYSGTSMASPHSAGAVALLWSCNPGMVGQVDLTFQALQNAAAAAPAGNCGAPPDGEGNYTFGYGYLDVLTAGIAVCGGIETGTLEGYVVDQDGDPVAGATVTAQGAVEGSINATTDPNGFYTMDLVVGTYNVTASKTNYTSQTQSGVEVLANQTVTLPDFVLTFLGAWTQLPMLPGCPDWTRYDGHYYDGLVYFLGGRSDTSTYGDVIYLDPATGTCTDTGANMPDPVSNYTINQVNNGSYDLLCTFGGRAASGTSTLSVQCYNPATNSASIVTTLPTAYTGYTPGGQAVVDNMVYVYGGFNSLASPYELNRTDRYDPVANNFTQVGNLALARAYIDSAVVDGKIYGFGGTVFDGASLYAQTIAEVFDPAAGTWNDAAVADLPVASAEGRAWGFDSGSPYVLAGKIVIAGGGQWPAESNEALLYDVATDTYDYDFPNLNISRRDHAGVWVPGDPGVMWVFGGRSSASGYGGDLPPYAPPEYYEVPVGGVEQTVTCGDFVAQPATDPYGRIYVRWKVEAVDQAGASLPLVSVDAALWWPTGGPANRTRLTHNDGYARFPWGSVISGDWAIDVTNMTLAGYTFVDGANCSAAGYW